MSASDASSVLRWSWIRDARLRAASSASGMVEQSILLLFTVIRLFLVVQLSISITAQLSYLPQTQVAVVCGAVAIAYSLTWIIVANATGKLAAWPWGVVDVALALVILAVCQLTLPPNWVIGTWLNWSVAYVGRVVVFVPAWTRSIRASIAVGLVTAVLYLILVLPGNDAYLVAVLENFADFPFFVGAAIIFFTTARRVAKAADSNRTRAIELGAEVELLRYRAQVHDATGLLANLARPDIPAELLPSLKRQAAAESNRLRNEILQPRRPQHDDPAHKTFLDTVVLDAASGFTHLPLRLTVARARDVHLSGDQAVALKSALVALLYNVTFHAQAEHVTVFADRDSTTWEVSVCDDGVGFRVTEGAFGFGLGTQVIAGLSAHNMSATIDSQPGAGTSITLHGVLDSPTKIPPGAESNQPSSATMSKRSPGARPKARSTSAGE